MGMCACNGANNEVISRELPVPVQVKIPDSEKEEVFRSDVKQNTKKMVHFTKIKNDDNFSLSSVLNEITNEKIFKASTGKTDLEVNNSPGKQRVDYSQTNKKSDLLRKLGDKGGGGDEKNANVKSSSCNNVVQITNDQDDINNILPHNKDTSLTYSMGKDIEFSFSSKVISQEEENLILNGMKNHYIFMKFNDEVIKALVDMMSLIKIEEETFLFREGEKGASFFIIKSGVIEIKTNKKSTQLVRGHAFGELGLLSNDCVRQYSAVSKSQIEIYLLTKDIFTQVLSDNHVTLDQTIKSNFVEINYLLKELPANKKENLLLLAKTFQLKPNDVVISTMKKENSPPPILTNSKAFIYVKSGAVNETFYHPETTNKISSGELTGIIHTIFKPHDKNDYEIVSLDNTECFIITETALIEAIGANYRYEVLLSFFNPKITKSDLIKELLKNQSTEALFKGFNIKEYKSNEIVFNHSNFENKKMCMLLNGDLISSKNNKIKLTKGILYGDKLINSNDDLEYDIIAKKNATFTLECPWKEIKDILKEYEGNQVLFENYDYLSRVALLRNMSESKIFAIAKYAKKEKVKKDDIIIPENTLNDKFYLLVKGRVKLKDPVSGKTTRVYDEGNCFGELGLLNDTCSSSAFTATESTICYTIDKDSLFNLLQDQNVNDYMRQKMILEDPDISIDDLYYLSYLGRGRFGNVCLVHNKIAFYAAKAVSKLAAEKQKTGVKNLLNEKKTMICIDHPFVVKLVKTLKKDNWCFILEEFICGKNFGEYLDSRKIKKNVYETKFYGAILLVIIDYLNRRQIVHRDIKPTNIMMDYNGYLKMIDFGTARKLKNVSTTVIGTPNFIAPEVLLSKGYSFPCDYWSIGVCLFYIYSGILPFGHKVLDIIDIYKEILEKEPEFPKDCPIEIKNLISGLLNKKPNQRINSLEAVKAQSIYKNFLWDDLLKFKLKPFFVPYRDPRDNPANLTIQTSPFATFMECEKFETIQMQTLKINNTKEMNRSNSTINVQWFEDF